MGMFIWADERCPLGLNWAIVEYWNKQYVKKKDKWIDQLVCEDRILPNV